MGRRIRSRTAARGTGSGTCGLPHPESARELGAHTAMSGPATGDEVVAAAGPGCRLRVATPLARLGKDMPLAHTVRALDAAFRAAPP
ncbi:hypothetical protein OIB37_05530 [Streptomyces sp. NBC_00820]|uniref:hypothetical protein n=1 Tax=Streptomyces sp. NBC_00820 TaxID=2975842 RepID=UPI002ED5AC28|nr:hypothetical protein OIB37_05530 [Streptomyces sp. NBC_00820]